MSSPGIAIKPLKPLVTLSGECFDAQYKEARSAAPYRDGVLYYFTLVDLARNRGSRFVTLYRSGPDKLDVENYEARIDAVRLNRLRQAFDSGELNFKVPSEHGYQELTLRSEDFRPREHAADEVIRKFIRVGAYWLGFKLRPDVPNFFVDFECVEDLDYLGITKEDFARNLWLLREQDYLKASFGSLKVSPTRKLIEEMENPPREVNGIQNRASVEGEDRKFARMAVDEARKSASENDNRVHPKVGAVVVKDGLVLSTAHRGEIAGNHAEFTALEKKLTDEAVAGACVYTTLEPCTTRTHPKIPCAERLIERRVARVVIGMLDPDDRITGKGVRKLQKAGIETVLFPHDLAMEVEELNREFTRSCEQSLRTEVGPVNMELWKEIAALRTELAEFKRSVETRERNREEFESFPVSFVFDQGSPGNYSGSFKNDSKYKVSVEAIQILRGDTNYECPLTEAVKPRPNDDWVVEAGQQRTLFWGSQYDPINTLRSLIPSSAPNFLQGKVIPIAVSLTFTADGKRLNKKFTRQVLVQGSQLFPYGP